MVAEVFSQVAKAGDAVAGIIGDKAIAEADQAIKEIDRKEKAELDSLSRISMSEKQREEEKKKIEINAEQRRAAVERKRIKALIEAAKVQKAADIASIISSTAAAIMGFLKNPGGPAGIGFSIGAGITGALQLARAAAAPLPQYKDGTDFHKGGSFIAGDGGGVELITTPDGRSFLSADTPTLYPNMPKGTKVLSNEDLMQQIYNSAIVKLSGMGAATSNKMEQAMMETLEEFSGDVKDMKRSIDKLKLTVNISGDYSHIAHVKSRIR